MPVVPANALQERLLKQQRLAARPDKNGKNSTQAKILKVYDADEIDENGIPDDLVPHILREPGTLFAKVETTVSKRKLIVGFEESEAQILSTHGNGMLLEGMPCTIVYKGYRIKNGRIVLRGAPGIALRGFAESTNVFDISGML